MVEKARKRRRTRARYAARLTSIVRKTSPLDLDYFQALNSTMNEWKSDEDEQAYKNL